MERAKITLADFTVPASVVWDQQFSRDYPVRYRLAAIYRTSLDAKEAGMSPTGYSVNAHSIKRRRI